MKEILSSTKFFFQQSLWNVFCSEFTGICISFFSPLSLINNFFGRINVIEITFIKYIYEYLSSDDGFSQPVIQKRKKNKIEEMRIFFLRKMLDDYCKWHCWNIIQI